ncbi:MAG: hypothetical protein JW751_32025 [Polyangiaceae bacterium]|nr:hypothetical protein [Polyangiaceae bacterium]
MPLSRPGAFVVAAVDEATQAAVGTTGAVLTVGEELRTTGSDRALLRRLAELSSGKVRDTMAGVFRERDVLRFAYRSITAWLVVWAAVLLLLEVAARRLAVPAVIANLPARWQSSREARAERRARRRAAARTAETDATAQVPLATRREARAEHVGADAPAAAPPFVRPRSATVAVQRPPPVAVAHVPARSATADGEGTPPVSAPPRTGEPP